MTPTTERDCEFCPDHGVTDSRISALEKDRTVMEANSATVGKLTTRVSLLITIMSIGTLTVLAGTIYTFTAIAQFKSEYSEHRIAMIEKMNSSQKETVEKISEEMSEMERRLDDRMDDVSGRLSAMEGAIKRDTIIKREYQ